MSRPDRQRSDLLISVVASVCGQPDQVEVFLREVSSLLAAMFTDYEIVLVDNASRDGTADTVARLQRELRNIQAYTLARPVDSDTCFVVGLERAIGDLVVTIDPLTDPVSIIREMVRVYDETGADIVYGLRSEAAYRDLAGRLYAWASKRFFALYRRITKDELPQAASSFRLYSRRSLNSFLDNRDRYLLFPVVATFSGYEHRTLPYEAEPRAAPGKLLVGGFGRALRILLLSSHWPLRLLSFAALAAASLNLLYTLYIVAVNIFKAQVAEGWTSLSLQMSGMFFLLFVLVAVLCEYVVRMFMYGQERPPFVIVRESRSLVLERKRELNVAGAQAPREASRQ